MGSRKIKVSVALTSDLVKRIDALAKAVGRSRSDWIELALLDSLDQEELGVKVLTHPVLGEQLLKVFSDRAVIRQMLDVMGEKMSDDQLQLFTDAVRPLVHGGEPAVVKKMKAGKKGRVK